MSITRLAENPLLTPDDLTPTQDGLEIYCTLNPAATRYNDEILLLVRVGERPAEQPKDGIATVVYDHERGETRIIELSMNDPALDSSDPRKFTYRGRTLLTSLSHLRLARSTDGRNFTFDPEPAIFPATPYEAFGCEDARITFIEGKYWITYTSVSDRGVTVSLVSTEDFKTFTREEVMFPPFQKDVVIFPEKVRGMYVCRHRPYMNEFSPASIWTAYSPDLFCWGRHDLTLEPTPETWESERVGCGGTPIKTDEGWLEIYHASDVHGRYCLGASLSDLEHPERIVTRSKEPVFWPEADYEVHGVFANCVFTNGMVTGDDGTITMYYGAADQICAGAVTTVADMVAAARNA